METPDVVTPILSTGAAVRARFRARAATIVGALLWAIVQPYR